MVLWVDFGRGFHVFRLLFGEYFNVAHCCQKQSETVCKQKAAWNVSCFAKSNKITKKCRIAVSGCLNVLFWWHKDLTWLRHEILSAGAVVPHGDWWFEYSRWFSTRFGSWWYLRSWEITLRTPVGLDAIRLIAKEVPNAIVGAGTVTHPEQLKAVADAGAVFAIRPWFARIVGKSKPRCEHSLDSWYCHTQRGATCFGTRYGYLEAVPCRSSGRQSDVESLVWSLCERAFLPNGWHHIGFCAWIFGIAQRVVCWWHLANTEDAVANRDWDTITRLAKEASALRAWLMNRITVV